jgi:hypothetical protein
MRRLLSPRALSITAIGVLLFLVSVPRVHQLALLDNERDAQSSVRLLIPPVFGSQVHAAPAELPTVADLASILRTRLVDVQHQPGADLIHRHGYLIDVARDPLGRPIIRAWPSDHGQTGTRAFLYYSERGLLSHPNGDGRWSGLATGRPDGTELGWQLMSQPL